MSETPLSVSENKKMQPRLSINSDLIFFKNEVLGDMNQIEKKLTKKMNKENDELQNKLLQLQNKLDIISQKLIALSNYHTDNNQMKEKIESLFEFKPKVEDTFNAQEFKINSISKDLVQAINKYDRIIESNLIYHGIIGTTNARFNTFHNFIDYVLSNIGQLINFKDKIIGIDFKEYKSKLDSMIESLKKQADTIIDNNKIFTVSYVDNIEKGLKSHLNLFEQKIFDLKVQNSKSCKELESLTVNLIKEMEKITKIKREIDTSFEKNIEGFKYHYYLTESQLNQCQKDYNEMKRKFDLLVEFLKGVKSTGGGYGSRINFNDFMNLKENNQDYNKKKSNAESFLRKYIDGEMNMEQISQLSRKSKKNISFGDIPKSSKFLSQNIINNLKLYKKNSENINYYNNINTNSNNNYYNFLKKSISTGNLAFNFNNKINENFKDKDKKPKLSKFNNNFDKNKFINEEKNNASFKRYNSSFFDINEEDENKSILKEKSIDKSIKNSNIKLNKSVNIKSNQKSINKENQSHNLSIKDNKYILISEKDEIKENDSFISETNNSKINDEDKNENESNKGFDLKKNKDEKNKNEAKAKFKDIDNSYKKEPKIEKAQMYINKEGKEEKKLIEKNHINNKIFEGGKKDNNKEKKHIIINSVDNQINKKNNIKNNINLKNNSDYDYNLIIENNENEEKEDDINNSNNTYNYNFLENLNNQSNNQLASKSLNDYSDLENSFNKQKLNKNISANNFFKNQRVLNDNNKNNLLKLFKGDVNALKFINIGKETLKIPKNSSADKINMNSRKINLKKNLMKNNTNINFFPSNNPINKTNYLYFGDKIKNVEFNSDNYGFAHSLDYGKNYNTVKVNKMNISEYKNFPKNVQTSKQPKLNVINFPAISEKINKDNNFQNIKDDFYLGRKPLRKIKYENNLKRKNKGPQTSKI